MSERKSRCLGCVLGLLTALGSGCGNWAGSADPDWEKSRLPIVGLPKAFVALPFAQVSALAWTEDGQAVVAWPAASYDAGSEIQRIDLVSDRVATYGGLPASEITQGSPDGQFLALVGSPSPSLRSPLYLAQSPDYRLVLLDSTQRYQAPVWSGDSRTLAYVTNYREEPNGTFTWSFVVVDARTRQQIAVIDDFGRLLALSPDGGQLLALEFSTNPADDQCTFVIHDVRRGSATQVGSRQGLCPGPEAVRWDQRGIRLFASGPGPGEVRVVSLLDSAASFTVGVTPCSSGGVAAVAADGRTSAFICYERIAPPDAEDWVDFGRYMHLFLLDLDTREASLMANGPGCCGLQAAFSPDGRTLAFYGTWGETGRVYFVNLQ